MHLGCCQVVEEVSWLRLWRRARMHTHLFGGDRTSQKEEEESVRKKGFPFSRGANLGGFGLFRNGGKGIFEIMGQAGVFPAIYPNGAKMALG